MTSTETAAAFAEDWSRRIVEVIDDVVCLCRDGVIVSVNAAAARLLAASLPDRLVGCRLDHILHPDHAPPLDLAGAIPTVLHRLDGGQVEVELSLRRLGGPDSAVVVVHARDLTGRKRDDDERRLANAVFETTQDAIMVLDAQRRVTAVNAAFTEITGRAAAAVLGTVPELGQVGEGVDADLRAARLAAWEAVDGTGRWAGELCRQGADGQQTAERVALGAIRGDGDRITQYVVVFSDVTKHKQDEEQIRYQANYDSLTGLPNRSLCLDRLSQAVATSARSKASLGLMVIDLDGFKLVNDTLGHELGDELLRETARRLNTCVRSGDTLARLGGDEFTIIMPNLGDFRNAPLVARRVLDSLEQPFDLKGHEAFVSASIGITTFPDDAKDTNTLLKNADAAMFRAKEKGKANFQFFTADMNTEVTERLVLKNGLSKALEREEFTLYYQPKIDLASGLMTGVEALLRWRNSELGSVSPTKFIPVMEESGLIGAVGEWALEVACLQHRAWLEAGFPKLKIAVNLSVRQLREPGLAKMVADMLVRTGIEPSGIELEITESMIMKDTEHAVATLKELEDMGISLAMDDFGTGYSSLSYLKRFPLHTIKIDRSFVSDIASDPDDLEIIRTIITMGHSLRRKIVAEGVETQEQREILTGMRCDEIQGYLVSPPVPAAEIGRMLIEGIAG